MKTRPIQTDAEYRSALREVSALMSAKAGTKEGERLDALVSLIQAYERAHHSVEDAGKGSPSDCS